MTSSWYETRQQVTVMRLLNWTNWLLDPRGVKWCDESLSWNLSESVDHLPMLQLTQVQLFFPPGPSFIWHFFLDTLVLFNKNHGCWCPGVKSSQAIYTNGNHIVLPHLLDALSSLSSSRSFSTSLSVSKSSIPNSWPVLTQPISR